MGLIAGICSRNQSDVSELLYRMAIKIQHRGDSPFCICIKHENAWESMVCENPKEILDFKIHFGIIGRHLVLDHENETIPYSDCQNKSFFLIDGQIFNLTQIAQELTSVHKGNLANPGVVLHLFEELREKIIDFSHIFEKLLMLMEGIYTGTFILKEHVFIFRDLIGIKPLYTYLGPKYIAFASEKKALWGTGFKRYIKSLQPGRIVQVTEKGFTSYFQAEFNWKEIEKGSLTYYTENLLQLLRNNILKLKPVNPFSLLLSGGIDSTLLAALLTKIGINFHSLVIGSEKSKDIQTAQQAAESLGIPLEILKFNITTLEELLPLLIYHVESSNEKKLNIAFPLFLASYHLKNQKYKVVFTGQGADEIFGGYRRYEIQLLKDPRKLQNILRDDIQNLYLGNLQRDDAVSMAYTLELRLPYLTQDLIEFSMQIPASWKIQPPVRKYILRQVGKKIGLSEEYIKQPKRAIQFSSGSHNTLKKLGKELGFTKDFTLKNGFFSPTQLFIDSLAYILGFPDIEPKIIKFVKQKSINWPDSFLKFKNIINKII
ncbi:MAG: asparagine synthase-related protein [Promethearchaeota archaeon]